MRRTEKRGETEEGALAFRIGGAALGMLSGAVVGFLVAVLIAAKFRAESYFALSVFGGAAAGALVGYLRGSAGVALAEGAVHFVVGFLSGVAERIIHPAPEAPLWLRWVFWLGVVVGFAFIVRIYW